MIQWAISKARSERCVMVQLDTDMARPRAQAFYQRLGFEGSHLGMKLMLA